MTEQPQGMDSQQFMQLMQQKLGNLELTVHSLLALLQEKDVVDQDEMNEKAQEIIEEMQGQQAAMQEQLEEEDEE